MIAMRYGKKGEMGTAQGGETASAPLTLVWENPNPWGNFGSQTISLDLSAYGGVMIEFLSNVDTTTELYFYDFCLKDRPSRIMTVTRASSPAVRSRNATMTDTGIEFANGYNNENASSKYCVPTAIYGFKVQ